jgi:hypothetical protein
MSAFWSFGRKVDRVNSTKAVIELARWYEIAPGGAELARRFDSIGLC